MRFRRFPFALPVAAALSVGLVGCGGRSGPAGGLSPGGSPSRASRLAPDFSLTALDGASYSLSDLKGRSIVLNFWASSCPACAQLAPRLESIYLEHKAEGLLVLGVAGTDSEEALKRKAESLNISYPIALSEETAAAYGVRIIPMTFFIDRDGGLAASVMGAADESVLADAVQKIL